MKFEGLKLHVLREILMELVSSGIGIVDEISNEGQVLNAHSNFDCFE